MKKDVLDIIKEYVNNTMPNATEEEKQKAVDANVIALLRY